MSLQELRVKAELGASVAYALSQPVLVTDRIGRVLFKNAAATRLLREPRRGLLCAAGVLRAAGADYDRALERAIADAAERQVGSVVRIGAPGSSQEAICRVVPLPDSGRMSEESARRAAIVSITTRGRSSAQSARSLEGLFGLTRAQCEVLVALLGGSSIEEIAAGLEITISTVRSHLQQAFLKTGTRRQAELVALLTSVVALGASPEQQMRADDTGRALVTSPAKTTAGRRRTTTPDPSATMRHPTQRGSSLSPTRSHSGARAPTHHGPGQSRGREFPAPGPRAPGDGSGRFRPFSFNGRKHRKNAPRER